MEKLYPMHEAIKILGVSLKTLQRWDKAGKIKIVRTPGGRRRVPESEIKRLLGEKEPLSAGRVLAIYARVSSHEQKAKGDLDRQVESVRKKFDHRLFDEILVIADVSSGLNDRRKGLLKLMQMAREGKITDLAVSYKDRLTRFGFNYLKTYFESYGVKIHVVNGEEDKKTVYEELVEDLLSIVTSFSGKLYGISSRKKEEVTSKIREVIENAGHLPDENR
ncbi:IS607 family transposase [Desulfofundulus thermocisternus]|uniref:IS607 family transposase n=1 Tax=Desulfofundulus thermocisternus TaxID=42471 RepID=UPI00217E701D|nr:IS607 family transposase [Desulfofundulus thermocisternus]MCS5696646.1 IS607 family transposase [Desulfofundulus thermocisternus]